MPGGEAHEAIALHALGRNAHAYRHRRGLRLEEHRPLPRGLRAAIDAIEHQRLPLTRVALGVAVPRVGDRGAARLRVGVAHHLAEPDDLSSLRQPPRCRLRRCCHLQHHDAIRLDLNLRGKLPVPARKLDRAS